MKEFVALLVAFTAFAGCSDTLEEIQENIEDSLNPQEPFSCVDDTCETDEMCVRRQNVNLSNELDDTFTCEPVIPTCETSFCECEETDLDSIYDNMEIIGCDAMGERHLTLAMVGCGVGVCEAGEFCLEIVDSALTVIDANCEMMPISCTRMCFAGCGAVGETYGGAVVQGCGSYSLMVVQ